MVGVVGGGVVLTGREKGVVRSGRAVVEAKQGSQNRRGVDLHPLFIKKCFFK